VLSKESPHTLSWYNPQKGSWELERTKYVVYVGSSSRGSYLVIAEIAGESLKDFS
jgi:hypothetical protein